MVFLNESPAGTVTGFVAGDIAGRWFVQHRLHIDVVDAYSRPLQVRNPSARR